MIPAALAAAVAVTLILAAAILLACGLRGVSIAVRWRGEGTRKAAPKEQP